MRTDKQIEASRLNGSKSRGPVTAQGRRNSGLNKIRHGLFASTILLDGESRERFAALMDSLYAEYQPQTTSQELLVEKMAVAQWRQMRLWTYERCAITREAAKQRAATGLSSAQMVDSIAYSVISPSALSQHEMRLDRQFDRCYDRLTKLKSGHRTQEHIENKEQLPEAQPEEPGN